MATGYFLKLNHFEGPLDLLLYLIKLNEMDIFEVNLAQLAEQYLSYLRLMQFADLKDASAFLVMAATLCEIKTRRLLPNAKKEGDEDGLNEVDLEAQLKERLIEYQQFRDAGEFFSAMDKQTDLSYSPVGEWERLEKIYGDVLSPLYGDPAVLVVLYEQLLSSLIEKKPIRLKTSKELITVERVVQKLLDILKEAEVLLFQTLYDKIANRYELIAYVIALLESLRQLRGVHCYQETQCGAIWVYNYDEKDPEAIFAKIKEASLGEP